MTPATVHAIISPNTIHPSKINTPSIIPDDEVYMSTRLDNIASLKVQLHNNAYIHHTDNEHYYTRIRIK